MKLRMDLGPWRVSRDFRLLWSSGAITVLGSFLTYVAVPLQLKELTGSYVAVGLLGIAEFVPAIVLGLYGGALADALDRRKLVALCEAGLLAVSAGLLINALLPHPLIWPIYLLIAILSGLDGLQRPSLDALLPRYVPREQVRAAYALGSVRYNLAGIVGPSVGGLVVFVGGVRLAYLIDVATFVLSLLLLLRMSSAPPTADAEPAGLRSIVEGVRLAAQGFARHLPDRRGRDDLRDSERAVPVPG